MSRSKHRSVLLIVCAILLVIGIAAIAKTQFDRRTPDMPEGYGQVTLRGETVCLPHKDTDGPTTLECAFGLRTANGDYYALDMSAVAEEGVFFDTGKDMTLKGIIDSSEASASKYDIQGTLRVNSVE